MPHDPVPAFELNRRHWLTLGVSSAVGASLLRLRSARSIRGTGLCATSSRRITNPRMVVHARTRFRGSTRTAITISPPLRMSNSQASTTSRESWRDAVASTAWVRTTRATASRGALLPPTTAIWRASIGRRAGHIRLSLPTHDSRYSRDRRSLRTRSTTSTRPSHRKASIGLHQSPHRA